MHYVELKPCGERIEVIEDNLEAMLNQIFLAFINNKIEGNYSDIMTLENYLPVAKAQVRIEEQLGY